MACLRRAVVICVLASGGMDCCDSLLPFLFQCLIRNNNVTRTMLVRCELASVYVVYHCVEELRKLCFSFSIMQRYHMVALNLYMVICAVHVLLLLQVWAEGVVILHH